MATAVVLDRIAVFAPKGGNRGIFWAHVTGSFAAEPGEKVHDDVSFAAAAFYPPQLEYIPRSPETVPMIKNHRWNRG